MVGKLFNYMYIQTYKLQTKIKSDHDCVIINNKVIFLSFESKILVCTCNQREAFNTQETTHLSK